MKSYGNKQNVGHAAKQIEAEIKHVEIDALVILQIMKHCRQHVPHPVTGQLLGLDVKDTLQVTHSFGYVQKGGEEHGTERVQDDGEQYQLDMLKRLREVNVDSNTVGWYQTTHLGQFFSDTVIETQYQYQVQIPKTILLVYDPLQSSIGKPAFKAFRLTPEFVEKHTEARENNASALNDFNSADMFMEIPISINSPAIVEAFLVDWCISDPISTTTQLDALDVENQAFVEKNVQLLISSLQELSEEQQKLQQHERQAARGGDKGRGKDRFQRGHVSAPRQLDTMILSQQIQNYCKQINDFAVDSFSKLYLLSNKPTGAAGAAKK